MIKIFGLRILTKKDMEKIDDNFEKCNGLVNELNVWSNNLEERLVSLHTLIDLQQEQLDILADEVFKKETKKKGTKKKE